MNNNIKKMVFIALLVAQALVLYIIESGIPPVAIPGAKLGLTNIVTVIAINTLDLFSSFFIVLVRVLLSAFISSNLQTMVYSLSGAMVSLTVMVLLKKILKDKISLIGVSVIGAMFHNLGQLIAASFMVNNARLLTLLPVLSLIAIPTGIFVGLVSEVFINHVKKLKFYKEMKSQHTWRKHER